MKLYFAAAESALKELNHAGVNHMLISMANGKRQIPKVPAMFKDYSLIIDSGAFTYAKKKGITLEQWIKEASNITSNLINYELISLDVIGNAPKTKENWDALKDIFPGIVPTFHVGSDLLFLKQYANSTSRICIGGMVPYKSEMQTLRKELNKIFSLFSKDSMPRFHAFGYFSQEILDNYPWYSADASTWQNYSRFGEFHTFDKFIYKRNKSINVEQVNYNTLNIDELHAYLMNTPDVKLKLIVQAMTSYQKYLTNLWQTRNLKFAS